MSTVHHGVAARTLIVVVALAACGGEGGVAREDIRCTIQTLATVELRMDTTITLDQPDFHNFALDSRGETYASPTRGGGLLHWAPDGTMLPLLGSTGEGPGQFAGGPVIPFIVRGDSLYARDNHMHWVVYGPDHQFVRFGALGPIGATSRVATQFLPNGLVLSANQNGDEHSSLLFVNRAGEVLRRLRPAEQPGESGTGLRAAFASSDGTFWVGPSIHSRGGYSVQQWDSAGGLLREIRRSVPWFVADSLVRPFGKDGETGAPGERPFLFPRVHQVAVDSAGLLWVVTHVPRGPGAREAIFAATDVFEKYSITSRVLEKHVEIFDPKTGAVIAARAFPSAFLLMPNTSDAVEVTEDSSTGLRHAVRMKLQLQDASGAACR